MSVVPLLLDGFEKAFVGYATQAGKIELAVYDYDKMVDILIRRDRMPYEEAIEFIEFNTKCAWAGEGTPLILVTMSLKRFNEMVEDEMTVVKPSKNHPWAMQPKKPAPKTTPKPTKGGKK